MTQISLDPETYAHLHQLAMRVLGNDAQTLQPTGLLHEAWMRMAKREGAVYADRTHFLRTAAQAMRQILIDRVRAQRTQKRGAAPIRTTMSGVSVDPREQIDVVELDEMITALGRANPQAAEVVLMRTFGGLTTEETAQTLGVSAGTVKRHWRFARAWLLKHAGT